MFIIQMDKYEAFDFGICHNHRHPTPSNVDHLIGGICISMLERLLTWASATLEAAVDLNPTTSGEVASLWKILPGFLYQGCGRGAC